MPELPPIIPESAKGAPNGVVPLDADGKIPPEYLDTAALGQFLGVVADEAAMLAVGADSLGDYVYREDTSSSWIVVGLPATDAAGWQELSAAGQVTSVAGKQGAVVLNAGDVGAIPDAKEPKLDGIEPGAQVNPTAAEIGAAYEGLPDVNRFSDARRQRLDNVPTDTTAALRLKLDADRRGVAGGVAALDAEGRVVGANGAPVGGGAWEVVQAVDVADTVAWVDFVVPEGAVYLRVLLAELRYTGALQLLASTDGGDTVAGPYAVDHYVSYVNQARAYDAPAVPLAPTASGATGNRVSGALDLARPAAGGLAVSSSLALSYPSATDGVRAAHTAGRLRVGDVDVVRVTSSTAALHAGSVLLLALTP